jgi:hypothetical protein
MKMLVKLSLAALIFGFLVAIAVAQPPDNSKDIEEAVRLFKAAVEAQGGRAKLESVRTVLVTIGKEQVVYLYVLPDKIWSYTAWSLPLHAVIRLEDYATRQNYILQHGAKQAVFSPIVPERLVQSLDKDGNVRWMPQSTFLLESASWKPTIIGLVRNKKDVIVQTMAFGQRTDFIFDPKTHLPVREIQYESDDPSKEAYVTKLESYVNVNGIMFPSKVSFPGESPVSVKIETNVDYDPGILRAAPASKFGPEAWRVD